MTGQDLPRFREMFEILATTFRLKGDREAMLGSYFQALEKYPIDAVEQGYERLRGTEEYWPAPAKWISAIGTRSQASNLPLMIPSQIREYDEAERLFFEGAFCHCQECEAASVTHLALRYVPQLDRDGEVITMQHPRKSLPVPIGEWIHGARLRRWYTARAEFYEKLAKLKPGVKAELELAGS